MRVPGIARVRWPSAYRVISSRYPPIALFERVAEPSDWESLYALEQLTNPRLRDEAGDISLVPVGERVSGPGASWVMAAFTHIGSPSRFTDGSYGVYYAARKLETAIHETAFHMGRFYAKTREPVGTFAEMRSLVSSGLSKAFHDVRKGFPALHALDDYAAPQQLGASLRAQGSNGIAYRSVRDPSGTGECLAVLTPRAIPIPKQGAALRYHFDGARIDRWFRIGARDWVPL